MVPVSSKDALISGLLVSSIADIYRRCFSIIDSVVADILERKYR